MQKEEMVIVFDKMTSNKVRLIKIFEEQGIKVEDARSQTELMNILLQNEHKKNVLIMTIDEEMNNEGLELLRRIKSQYPELLVLILTSISKREFFAKCIAEGALDYILKPYDDYVLLQRVQKLLNVNHGSKDSVVNFNFPGYLRSEILKAKKGKYPFTLLKSTVFYKGKDGVSEVDVEYTRYSSSIYERLNSLFWETDIFIQYKGDSFLGFFPFCGEENSFLIEDKVNKKFEEIKELNANIRKYVIVNSFVTFPKDGDEVNELLTKLTLKINDSIKQLT